MLVLHTRWTLWHHKMDAILSQFFPWMLVHHTRKSADFSKIPWSLVLHTSWMLFRHTRGWTFFLHTMDVKDGARKIQVEMQNLLTYTVVSKSLLNKTNGKKSSKRLQTWLSLWSLHTKSLPQETWCKSGKGTQHKNLSDSSQSSKQRRLRKAFKRRSEKNEGGEKTK